MAQASTWNRKLSPKEELAALGRIMGQNPLCPECGKFRTNSTGEMLKHIAFKHDMSVKQAMVRILAMDGR